MRSRRLPKNSDATKILPLIKRFKSCRVYRLALSIVWELLSCATFRQMILYLLSSLPCCPQPI